MTEHVCEVPLRAESPWGCPECDAAWERLQESVWLRVDKTAESAPEG